MLIMRAMQTRRSFPTGHSLVGAADLLAENRPSAA